MPDYLSLRHQPQVEDGSGEVGEFSNSLPVSRYLRGLGTYGVKVMNIFLVPPKYGAYDGS
jgi:hypothetical protein